MASQHTCTPYVCSIIPPHVLRAISSSDAAPEVREAATLALDHTHALRENRAAFAQTLREATAPGIVPPHILRAVAESDTAEPEAKEAAERTLAASSEIRESRQQVLSEEGLAALKVTRNIYDAQHKSALPGQLIRAEGKPESKDSAINEVYDGLGTTFDFYSKFYKRDSINGKGMELNGSAHYLTKYNNAMWDGYQMVFGDGDGVVFASGKFTGIIDVIGHELTHGVTQYTCNLRYDTQSGALNESVSDCFGSLIKQYKLNQKPDEADWLIGEGIWAPNINGKALRSMKEPGTAYDDPTVGKDPQPASMSDFVTTDDDEGGVHINSGIPNRAFYLVAVGLKDYAWNTAGKIWYATLNDKRTKSGSNFKQFADVTVAVALRDFDQETSDVVKQAWTDVGVYSQSDE